MEEAAVMMVGLEVERVLQGLSILNRKVVVKNATCVWWQITACQM